jgi:CheY-like chemotaxis protein
MIKKKVFIVENNPSVIKTVEAILSSEEYKISNATSGEQALSKLQNTKPDLILIDYFMPRMNGIELCGKIREKEKFKNTKIAFLTVADFIPHGVEGKALKRLKVLGFITKPFENDDLIRKIKSFLT